MKIKKYIVRNSPINLIRSFDKFDNDSIPWVYLHAPKILHYNPIMFFNLGKCLHIPYLDSRERVCNYL